MEEGSKEGKVRNLIPFHQFSCRFTAKWQYSASPTITSERSLVIVVVLLVLLLQAAWITHGYAFLQVWCGCKCVNVSIHNRSICNHTVKTS